jgi:acetyl-CoA acetyltransferase family protein
MDSRAQSRIQVLNGHITSSPAGDSILETAFTAAPGKKSPDDIVIVKAVRTAIAKAKRGGFKDASAEKMLAPLLKHLITSTGLDPKLVGDIVIGTVLPRSSQGATEVRIAALLAGFPAEVACMTVNRQCSSGLQALADVAGAIRSGTYEIGIAGGVETMSQNPMGWDGSINEEAINHPLASGCYLGMGQTSENVAERYKIPRQEQDEFSVRSHQLAAAAQAAGKFDSQIVPVEYTTDDGKKVVVSKDEGIRAATTLADLAKLKPAFKEGGSTTAGNSSQLSDGAGAMIVTKRSTAERLKLPIQGIFRSFAVIGVEPAIMGVGPAYAIPPAVKRAGLTLNDIDVYEINEAFASQCTYSVKKLGLDMAKVNPNGGAIALGHPLGCTGARLVADILPELKRRNAHYGVVSMCIGSGMGAAAVIERE